MNETYFCSFCGKTNQEVRIMVRAYNNFICDECVSVCVEIMIDKIPNYMKQINLYEPVSTKDTPND